MAERQVVRRALRKKAKDVEGKGRKKEQTREKARTMIQIKADLQTARETRRQDWEMGPLAPRRDIPKLNESSRTYYGSVAMERSTVKGVLSKEELDARTAWAGGIKFLNLAIGDRVVVIEGPYKGRIAPIKRIVKDSAQVLLDDTAIMSNITVPPFLRKVDSATKAVQLAEAPVPISAVRLVHPVKDETTGETRDVIIKELVHGSFYFDRQTKRSSWARIVPGLNIRIPWPKVAPKEHEDHPVDTLRIDVEEKTFVPTLLRPPVPRGVIDELRNRYSIFRTRHEPEYIARKEAEAAEKQARKDLAKTMNTPLKEFNKKQRELRKALGQPVLTEEMLEKIGQVIAKNKENALEASGVAAVESGLPGAEAMEEEIFHTEAPEAFETEAETKPPTSS